MSGAVPSFPFAAVVGADDMALALILNAVSPQIGGVLVRGEKGTAKSTMVRGLAEILPLVDVVDGCRFSCDPASPDPSCPDGPHGDPAPSARPARLVELPVGATEDRVIGSMHLQKVLSDGVTAYEPGLLAQAHRGILYVDEVNLLHDHLVDVLLDAAAMGRSTVEREGISVAHAARFVLVGTMNPEEGELRPQLLDRFGLTVEVAAPRDPQIRAEVVRRRMAFDGDPRGFTAAYASEQAALADRILAAQSAIGAVRLDDEALARIATVCAGFDVDGMRADLVTARTARAHAAWCGRDRVLTEDIRIAAKLALPHRRRRNPFDAPGLDEDLLDQLLGEDRPPEPPPPDGAPEGEDEGDADSPPAPDDSGTGRQSEESSDSKNQADREEVPEPAEASNEAPGGGADGVTTVVQPRDPYRTRLFSVSGLGGGEAGHRSRAITTIGRTVGSRPMRADRGPIHLVDTVRAAARHQDGPSMGRRITFRDDDIRLAVREGRESNLVLLCVDASGSMAARRRMEEVKSSVLSLLLDAYQRRDKVGLVTFRAAQASVALPPTSSIDVAAARMRDLPAGGRTPLTEGLACAAEVLRVEAVRDPRRRPLMVVVTDGRATSGKDAMARAGWAARAMGRSGVASLVIDCETGRFRMGLAKSLAADLRAEYVQLGDVAAAALTGAIRERVS